MITALRTYVEKYNNWTGKQRELHWCTIVGLAQTLIPAHIRHHYCDPEEAFWNNPSFQKPKLKRSLEIYNWVVNKYQLWVGDLVGLGVYFGIYAGWPRRPAAVVAGRRGRLHAAQLSALTALDEARTKIDLPALIERLHTPIQNLEDNLGVQGMKV